MRGAFVLDAASGDGAPGGLRRRPAGCRRQLVRTVGVLLVAAPLVGQTSPAPIAETPAWSQPAIELRGPRLFVDDAPFVVKGVHYGPWRPGTGPGRSPYPTRPQLDEDMKLLAGLNANTLMTFDAPRELLDAAHAHGLMVMCGFSLEWSQIGSPDFAAGEDAAVAAVRAMQGHPAVLGWVLGKEIPSGVVTQHGASTVEGRLRRLYERVREIDRRHPVTHANWPTTRSLDLSFLDICSFNVHALWPPEVVAHGYESFLRDVIRPIAGGKPLLITEYGTNAIEAGLDGQARWAQTCWRGLRQAEAIGGFVLGFADEWWKDYSNPRAVGAWSERDSALDDHLKHDIDPEEHYGLFDGARKPKPASELVRAMYEDADSFASLPADPSKAGTSSTDAPARPTLLVIGLIAAAAVLYLVTVMLRRRDRRAGEAGAAVGSRDQGP